MNLLFVVDPLHQLDPSIDTSIGMMAAARADGHACWSTHPEDLWVSDGRLRARTRRLDVRRGTRRGDHRWDPPTPWHQVIDEQDTDVASGFDAVLLRIDPPVDARYLHTTYLLDLLAADDVPVLNRPDGVRNAHEKLFALHFPDLCPPTIVTSSDAVISDFLRSHPLAVVKPVDGFAGCDVWLLGRDDPNTTSLVDSATQRGTRKVVVQAHLAAVANGNKRLFVANGKILGAVLRRPAPPDFRIGPPCAAADINRRDRLIVDRLAPELRRLGIGFAGLDVIDGHLIEVNVTSPGALHKTDALLGTELCRQLVRELLDTGERKASA
jgi:glutathione synthase